MFTSRSTQLNTNELAPNSNLIRPCKLPATVIEMISEHKQMWLIWIAELSIDYIAVSTGSNEISLYNFFLHKEPISSLKIHEMPTFCMILNSVLIEEAP